MRYVEGVVGAVRNGQATVEVAVHQGGCGRCHETGGCKSQNISRALCDSRRTLTVTNTLGAEVGERVRIGMDEVAIGSLATRVYVLPLAGFVLGGVVGQFLHAENSLGGVIGALVGLGLAAVGSALYRTTSSASPVMVARLGQAGQA